MNKNELESLSDTGGRVVVVNDNPKWTRFAVKVNAGQHEFFWTGTTITLDPCKAMIFSDLNFACFHLLEAKKSLQLAPNTVK